MKEDYSLVFLKRFYPLWRKINFPRQHERMAQDAVVALQLERSARILELACGPGNTIKHLAKKIDQRGFILCTDFSTEMLRLAQNETTKFPNRKIRFKKIDSAETNFNTEFDVVICMLGLSVIPNYEQTILRAHQALKPRGKIAVVDAQLYKKFPFFLLNPFVKILHRIFKAKERKLLPNLNKLFKEILYKEYLAGSYFLYVGEKI